jgi:DNA ligase 1
MSTSFLSLSELLEKVEVTKKRLEIIDLVAYYLKTLFTDEIESAVNMMVGRAFPKYSQKTLNVNWSTLRHVIERVSQFDPKLFRHAMSATGDIGSAVKAVLEQSKVRKQTQLTPESLTISKVRRAFDAIAQTIGTGSRIKKEHLMTALFSQATPIEAKYLVKIFTGEMRTGMHEGLMERAIAKAFGSPLKSVQHASMVFGDIGEVAAVLQSRGIAGLEIAAFSVFRPVKLMLAQTAQNVSEVLSIEGGIAAFEYKYDGARVQIHIKNGVVEFFSRRLSDVTESLPEVVDIVKQNVRVESAILEGEVVALDSVGFPIAFQHLMRRFKRTRAVAKASQRIPLTLYLFDVLYLDGESLINLPYTQRRKILMENSGKIALSQQIITDKTEEAEVFLKEAIAAGHEGLMAKKIDSPYTPGRRGKKWLKIKPILETLDLVITAAEYGYGRRKGWLSDYYLAARNSKTGEFLDIGKTFKGLTDAEIIELTKRLKANAISETEHRVTVVPKIIVEVAYNEIQQSHKYESKMALRFARVTRIRDDKTPMEADTIDRVKEIFERQFNVKGKYTTGQQDFT